MRGRALEAWTGLAVVVLYLGAGTFDHGIWSPVEPTVAGVTWGMWESGELAVPRINLEHPFLDTPPLYFWMAVASARVLGELSPGAIRLPAVLLGLGCLGIVFWIARRAYGSVVACIAVLLAAVTGMFWDLAHRAATDMAGTAFAFLAFGVFARSLEEDGPARRRWDVLVALVLAGSFYGKNLYSVFVALPVIGATLLVRKEVGRLVRLALATAAGTVLLALPWAWALYEAGGGEYVRIALLDNTVGRLLPLQAFQPDGLDPINDAWIAERESWAYYVLPMLAYPLPWTPLALVAAARILRARGGWSERQTFLMIGLAGVPVVLSLSSAKSTDYLAPVLFFVFLLLADVLADWLESPERFPVWQRWVLVGNVAVLAGATSLAPLVAAALTEHSWPAFLGLPIFAVGWWLVSRVSHEAADGTWLARSALVVATGAAVFLFWGVPGLDARKSSGPFFEAIRPDLEGRALHTTFRDAYRLPLVNYGLGRAVPFVAPDRVAELLSADVPAAVLVPVDELERQEDALRAIPGLVVRAEGGRHRFRLVLNMPGG